MAFKKAQRVASKIKCTVQGASGSGKTYSALKVATELVALTNPGKRIAIVDTENSAGLYAPPFDFDVDDEFMLNGKPNYDPKRLIEKLEAARKSGEYGAVIVDSLTFFWKEAGGFTQMIDKICDAQKVAGKKPDSFGAWKQVDPLYREMMNYFRNYPLHLFLTVRSKQDYERSNEGGKGSLKKVGLSPEMREGFEFLVDAQFAVDQDHNLIALKHRLGQFIDGKVYREPGKELAEDIFAWINEGAPGQEVAPIADEPQTPSVEETGPETPRMPAENDFEARIRAAGDEATLKLLGSEIANAKKGNEITDEETRRLNGLYRDQVVAIRAKATAAA